MLRLKKIFWDVIQQSVHPVGMNIQPLWNLPAHVPMSSAVTPWQPLPNSDGQISCYVIL